MLEIVSLPCNEARLVGVLHFHLLKWIHMSITAGNTTNIFSGWKVYSSVKKDIKKAMNFTSIALFMKRIK